MLSLGNPKQLADSYFTQDGNWTDVEHTTEGVKYLKSTMVHTTHDKTEIYVTKAVVSVTGTSPQQVFNTYWNSQPKWDVSTVQDMKILQDSGNSQIVYYTHKTLSAASSKKDLVVERSYNQSSNGYVCYAHSVDSPLMPVQRQFGRANLLFHKCTISETTPGKVEIAFLWCFDFNGWIHVKFIDAEKTKCALRVSRIVKNTPGASFVVETGTTTRPTTPAHHPQRVDSNYAQFTQSLRAAEATVPPPTDHHQAYSAPVQSVQSTPAAGPRFCAGCGAAAGAGRFCSGCGFQLR